MAADPMFTQTVTRALSRLGLDQRGTDPYPRPPAPMLLQKAGEMISSPDWTYEPKWDGFRVLAAPHWVRPTLVVEVEYRQRLKDGLRHATL